MTTGRVRQNWAGFFSRIFQAIRKHIVAEVPQHLAYCEFDCPRTHWSISTCDVCPRRLAHAAMQLIPKPLPMPELITALVPVRARLRASR